MATAVFGNAIGWAQFRILGGWKNISGTFVAYTVALAAVMFAMARFNGPSASITYGFFLNIFMGLQVLVVLIYGSMRVAGSVRSDMTSGVIESHRLMPVTPAAAVLGYLFGSTFQALTLFIGNFLLGAIAVTGARMSMNAWVVANVVLLGFAIFVWTIVLFFAFRSGFATTGTMIGLGAAWVLGIGGGRALPIPAVQVLVSPIIGHTIFDMRFGLGGIDKAYFIAGVAQFAIAWIYCVAASRRYRRDDLVGFDPLLGLLLLALFTAVSLLGIRRYDWFSPFARFGYEREAAFEISVILVLLLAILPISSAVRLNLVPPAGFRRRRISPTLVTVAAFAISLGLVYAPIPFYLQLQRVVRTGITMLAFLFAMRFLLGIIHRLKLWPRRTIMLWLVLTWFVPVAVELVRVSWVPDPTVEHMSQIAFVSPPAEIFQIWSRDPTIHSEGFTGLAAQCALTLVLVMLYALIGGKKREPAVTPLATQVPA